MEPLDSSALGPPDPPALFWKRLAEVVLIGLLALTLNLAGNGRFSLWDRDEPRYAGCVREMRASGDWIHPTFNAQPRYDKPILIYWLMLAGTAIGGDNTFGARLVSSIAGAATCVVVWALGRRILGARAGRLAALMLATAPIMVAESKLSTTDATLTFWLVGCQACLWVLSERASRFAAAGFWVLLSLAVLTKGPIGPALIAMMGLASWWWGGPTACWSRLHWRWGLLGFVLLTAPWFVAVGLVSHGEFFHRAMGYHVLKRMTSGIEQHGALPGYYIATSLLTFHPWSALLPAALWGGWMRRRLHSAFGFLLGWIVGPLILLECVQTKLVHYYLPAYPACALLIAWMVGAVARDEVNLRRWPLGRLSLGLLAGVGLGLTAALVAAAIALPDSTRWPCLALAAIACIGTLCALERFQKGSTERAAANLVATWAIVMALFGAWLLPAAEPYRYSKRVAQRLEDCAQRYRAVPVLGSYQEPNLIYALGRPLAQFQSRTDLLERVRREGTVVSALLPKEVPWLLEEPLVKVELAETLRGFNLNKGRTETLWLTMIRWRGSAVAGRAEQTFVK